MTVPVSDRLSQLYVGNDVNKRFDFTFRVFKQEDTTGIAVRIKKTVEFETLDPALYTVTLNQDQLGGYVIFNSAPKPNTYFYIAGATPLDQLLDITNYDNFYPDAIERALDKLTALLQEWGVSLDQEKQARILADLHYDSLAMEREENLEARLTSYINAMIGMTNPAVFDGITDRMVITKDGRTQREFNESIPFWTNDYVNFKQATYLREEQILDHVAIEDLKLAQKVIDETSRAMGSELQLQEQINSNGIGNRAYKTYAEMVSDKVNIPAKSKVTVTNDTDVTKNGDYQYDGTNFTKSAFDPVKQAEEFTKNYVSNNSLALKPNLADENLNSITAIGLYRQIDNTKATLPNNYPTDVNGAGILEVINNSGLVIQEYTTWYNRKFRRTKYGSFDFLAWQELPNASDIVMYYKPNLGTEDLDTVLTSGIYRQISDANSTIESHYPTATNGAGILDVINRGNLVIQEYTTWFGLRYWRTKYSTFAFGAWQKYATIADLALAISIKTPLLTTEDLDTLTVVGIYRQQQDGNATPERHYPNVPNAAGVVEVVNHNGLIVQYYTTWFARRFWRTKYSTFAWQSWKEVATIEAINSPYKGKTIAWIGDSIVEGNNHPNRIATLLGATVHKFGFASHTMSQYPGSPLGRDKGAMYRFAKAINTGDWSDVKAGAEWVRDNTTPPDDNTPQVNAMAALDWNTVDYIMIAFGTNDIYSTTPLGELTDVADETGATFVGATKYSIEKIQEKYPHIQIMLVTPTFRTRWFQPDRPEQNSDTLPDPQGKPYTAYIDALIHMKNLYHIPVFDFYRTSGLNIRTWSNFLSDGVHPKENGIQLWTKKICGFMLAN